MKVLLVVDIQNDFLPGGALAVKEGNQIIPILNRLIEQFDLVVATKDWHPINHGSFAVNHKGLAIGDMIKLKGEAQILWPVHCIQNTKGAAFSDSLDISKINHVFKKGTDPEIDSYSGFYDNGHLKSTGLSEFLKDNKVGQVFIVGLATDYCVKFTAFDAVSEGFETYVIIDGTKAVNLQAGDYEKAIRQMQTKGIKILESSEIE
jgi:nicotinamidase/pyrazinamidase